MRETFIRSLNEFIFELVLDQNSVFLQGLFGRLRGYVLSWILVEKLVNSIVLDFGYCLVFELLDHLKITIFIFYTVDCTMHKP